MKKLFPLLAAATMLLLFASCHSSEKVIYFQDLQSGESLPTQPVRTLTLQNGDKVGIIVSSAATPQVAARYNLAFTQYQVGTPTGGSQAYTTVYTIDENGDVTIPSLGRVHVAGLTRTEAAERIQTLLHNGLLNDAVVTVNAYDRYITVTGEVNKPGRITIQRDNITLLEAIGAAGDLTIYGRRDRILVLRQEGNETKSYYVDLRSKDLLNSPVYNLQQNDYVYVEQNKMRADQTTYNGTSIRQISTWLSVSSLLISLGILIFR